MASERMSEAQAANDLGVHPRTLRRGRKLGGVPHSRTPGGRVFYDFNDLVKLRLAMRQGEEAH